MTLITTDKEAKSCKITVQHVLVISKHGDKAFAEDF